MPNKPASAKDLRKSKKRQAENLRVKTNFNARFKQVQQFLKEGKEKEAIEAIRVFQKAADKAARKKTISKNKTDRKKSKLMKAINKTK